MKRTLKTKIDKDLTISDIIINKKLEPIKTRFSCPNSPK